MDLLVPKTYRLEPAMEAWLQARAEREGHGSSAVVLRNCIKRAMRTNGKKPVNGKKVAA